MNKAAKHQLVNYLKPMNTKYAGEGKVEERRLGVIPCSDWHVDPSSIITIHKEPGDLLPPLPILGGRHERRSPALSFRKNVSVHLIHQMS